MPRMPDWTDVRAAPRLNTGDGRRAARSAIPAALGRMGEVLGQQADANLDLELRAGKKARDETDALELARARSDWNSRRLNEDDQYDLSKNPKLDKWDATYEKNISKHKAASSAIISNPEVRARFEANIEDDITTGRLTIKGRREGIEKSTKRASGLAAVEDNLTLATRPGIDQKEADKIIAQSRADIDNMVAAGVLTPAEAIEKRRAFAKNYALLKTKQDIKDDPRKASAWLEGGKDGDVIRHFEGFRKAPYWDVNHYRVGYGSDTITRADGSVVKVKPGMMVTREDAERDLSRRKGEYQADIVKSVGPGEWASIPPQAKEALLSVAHNYGTLPDSVKAAIKTGDIGAVADAVEKLKGHNNGVNAGRRMKEAEIIRSGDASSIATPEYYNVLETDDRLALASQAEGEWAARERETREKSTLEAYQLKQALEDDIAQIEATGKASDLPTQSVVDLLGETETAKWLEKRDTAAAIYSAVTGIDTMPNDDIDDHVNMLEPKAGADDFAKAQKVYEAADKRAKKVQDLRAKDPAMAVDSYPVVMEAKKNLNPDDPASVQAMVKARLAAQQQIGIPSAMQQPLTRREAKAIIAPIEKLQLEMGVALATSNAQNMDPATRRAAANQIKAQVNDQIRETINQIEATYGEHADKVLISAIMASSQDKETANMTAIVLRKIAKGEKPTAMEAKAVDTMLETKQADDAMNGKTMPPAPKDTAPKALPMGGGARGSVRPQPAKPEKKGTYPRPSTTAVQYLLKNPSAANRFDELYGPGEAVNWLPKE